jgi:glutamate synthase domain-containing protein 2
MVVMTPRQIFTLILLALLAATYGISLLWPPFVWAYAVVIPLFLVAVYDVLQKRHNILRNYPLMGHWRYILLSIRPQIQQYFIMSDQNGRPFNKEQRDLVCNRAEKKLDELPFGSQIDMDAPGYQWINQSLSPTVASKYSGVIKVGNEQCKKPYIASRLNISAMSYGALSQHAIRALNRGASIGGFAHNTGEGGLSQYHLMEGGDIFWQIGTGYFGCRTKDGGFCAEKFKEKSRLDNVKMIEIKLSQGAKPAHGGILPAPKVSKKIAQVRDVPAHQDCISPPAHTAFSGPTGLLKYVKQLRELSGGKPIGFKMCLGIHADFMAICKAMIETKIYPDFITVDGAEGGTGAAPLEFTDHIGTPLNDALIFIHNCLVGISVRSKIKIISSGKIISGFDMASKIALGADMCNSARGMLFSLGCVQSRRCHTNKCPTGVATQNPLLYYGLNIANKAPKVVSFHNATIASFQAVLGAVGVAHPEELTPRHIHKRIEGTKEQSYDVLYHYLSDGDLLNEETIPDDYKMYWEVAKTDVFPSENDAYIKYYKDEGSIYVRSIPEDKLYEDLSNDNKHH